MAEFLSDPSVLTKDKLKSALVANNVALPNGEQRKGVYVELYLKNLTSQNRKSDGGSAEAFSSDEEPVAAAAASITARSGRKATRKTDRVRPEEIDVTELTNEDLKDQLLKYGVNAGPIVASTRKLYEKKLQKLLDQGPPQTTVIAVSKPVLTHNSRNGSADSDQYSDKEEETTAAAVPEPEAEPEPVPVVERPLRSREKTPVTTRTRSSQQKEEDVESEEDDFQVVNVERKTRRSSRRLDHAVPDPVSASEMPPVPRESRRFSALPKDPTPLLADTLPSFPWGSSQPPPVHAAAHDHGEALSADKKLSERAAASPEARGEEVQLSLLDTALLEVGPREDLRSPPGRPELKSSWLKRTKAPDSPRSASPQPSKDLIHAMCRAPPSPASPGKDPPRPLARTDLSATKSVLTPDVKIEKLSAAEQTPKSSERDVLKELFPNEVLNTPTGISATCRRPIKGAAGRPFSDTWQDSLRPRLTEHRYTTSSYTETRSVPRLSTVPLSVPKPAALPSVQVRARRRVPVWLQLLLLAAVAGFLLFVYQAMESNQISPFGQPSRGDALKTSGK